MKLPVPLFAAVVGMFAARAVEVSPGPYRGWPHAYTLDNGAVRAVVVPAVGRVMQFGFKEREGVFWENEALLGKPMPVKPWDTPGSFGGDKTWPAPQSAWNWPPPDVFDAAAVEATPDDNGDLLMASPVSPRFGIRTERRVRLHPVRPVMTIETTYHKVQGEPVEVSVWVITQVKEPLKAFLPIPPGTRHRGGLSRMWDWPSAFMTFGLGRVSITRDPAGGHKIGNDAGKILWVGASECLRIDFPRAREAAYPDDGCSAEIYTNGDPARYMELETLGPLRKLHAGESLSATNTYTLFRRTRRTPEAEADALLK